MSDKNDTIYDIFARKLYNLPDNWHGVHFKALDDSNQTVQIKGWICGVFVRGPKKGRISFNKKLSDPKTVYISKAQYNQCLIDFEKETEKCIDCFNHPGQKWIGWSKDGGNKFRECPKCKGTGVAPIKEVE